MTHGDSFSATVEYFDQKDREIIKKEHGLYKAEWDREFEAATKPEKSLAGKAMDAILSRDKPDIDEIKRDIDEKMASSKYAASYEQFSLMEKSGAAPGKDKEVLDAPTLSDLMGKLENYVGSAGKMMPYTKSVEIQLPMEGLRDIRVVDTPGINDPVKSREARTEDYLKECDVVFVVSPAGQFINSTDIELMNRLSTKEGVSQLYIVASRADNQLFGSVLDESGGDLHKAIGKLSDNLADYAVGVLGRVKKDSPEIAGQFDQLIKGGRERIIITSAICHALRLKYGNPSSWDKEGDMELALRNLSEDYPDYFDSENSAKANLELLSGVGKVSDKIALVRKEKDKIIAEKQADYISGQAKNVDNYLQALIGKINARIATVKTTDVSAIAAKKKQTETLVARGTDAVEGAYENCVEEFKADVRTIIDNESRTLFDETKNRNASAEETRIETEQWYTRGGFLWLRKDWHSKNYEVRTLRTAPIKDSLNELVAELEDLIVRSVEEEKKEWKNTVRKKVVSALRAAVDDDEQIDDSMLSNAIRRLVNSMELPTLDFDSSTFQSGFSGTIEDADIDAFMDEVGSYLSTLKIAFNRAKEGFLRGMEQTANGKDVPDMLFSGYRKELDILEGDIQNRECIIDRLTKCAAALGQLK